MYIGHHVEHLLFLSNFNETWIFFERFLKKYSNIKFNENVSYRSWVVPCGQTDKNGEADSRFSQFCEYAWGDLQECFYFNCFDISWPITSYSINLFSQENSRMHRRVAEYFELTDEGDIQMDDSCS